jgi:hypothetical protein
MRDVPILEFRTKQKKEVPKFLSLHNSNGLNKIKTSGELKNRKKNLPDQLPQ